jgi:hypothetical protein
VSNSLPTEISKSIKLKIYTYADEAKYASMSRPDSQAFMDMLVKKEEIGGVIEQHMPKAAVRTYIKDGVLNAYSKAHARKAKPKDPKEIIERYYNLKVELIEKYLGVDVFASSKDGNTQYIVVAAGTFLKWETALRKALLYVAAKPLGEYTDDRVHVFLILMAQGKSITPADKNLLQKALSRCGAKAHIVGE